MVKTVLFSAVEPLLAVESERAKAAIAQLAEQETAVILFWDGDRAELEPIRERLGLTTPFVVEGGSAIFTPIESDPFETPLGERDGDYFVYELGCPYVQARAGLRVLANAISHPLKGFGDFTVQQLERSLKVSEDEAHRAKAREFSEPFMTPKSVDLAVLKQSAAEMGFDVVIREAEDSRFSLLRGADANLMAAAKALIMAYAGQSSEDGALWVRGITTKQAEIDALSTAKGTLNWTGVLLSIQPDAQEDWLEAVNNLL
ncbi:MAG: haloacid dehalogenase [Cyanobacteria bacterium P01_C01_bin.69]